MKTPSISYQNRPVLTRSPIAIILVATISLGLLYGVATQQTGSIHFPLPAGQQFTNTGRQVLSISADGKQIVYVANSRLHIKVMAERDSQAIPGTEGAVTNPVFSPDGKFIAFWSGSDQTLKRISVAGGTPQTICRAGNPFGMSWSADDTIVFGQGANGIQRVPASGGTPETLVTAKPGELAHGPQFLPGGVTLLYTLAASSAGASMWDNATIVAHSLKSNESKLLLQGGSDGRYAPTGHIVYATSGKLMSVPFDAARVEVTGRPVTLIEEVRNTGTTTGTAQFSFSQNGSLVYLSAAAAILNPDRQLAYVSFDGTVKPIRSIHGAAFGPRISPNGRQVAYSVGSTLWIAELSSNAPPRQVSTTEPGSAPIWSPDGQQLIYISVFNNQEALFRRRADGSGTAELLVDRARAPESWSTSHQAVSFITLVGPSGDLGDYDIWSYSLLDKKATPLISVPPSAQSGSRYSPDGRWIAYESNETGRAEVYVEPLPRTGQKFQITRNGGSRPLWAPDGTKLFFDNNAGNPATMFSVNVRTQPTFSSTDPSPMPISGFVQPQGTYRRQFDITPDGQQFLMMFADAAGPRIEVVSNWFEVLKRR